MYDGNSCSSSVEPGVVVDSSLQVRYGRETMEVRSPRVVKMVLWLVRQATRVAAVDRGQVVFDLAGKSVRTKFTEAGEA